MKLYKAHAVLPRGDDNRGRVVRTYLAVADTWQGARHAIAKREPGAELVTVPIEIPTPLMIDARMITENECEDLGVACAWNEKRLRNQAP